MNSALLSLYSTAEGVSTAANPAPAAVAAAESAQEGPAATVDSGKEVSALNNPPKPSRRARDGGQDRYQSGNILPFFWHALLKSKHRFNWTFTTSAGQKAARGLNHQRARLLLSQVKHAFASLLPSCGAGMYGVASACSGVQHHKPSATATLGALTASWSPSRS